MNPQAIGIALDWEACLPLARAAGFQGIDVPLDPRKPAAYYRDLLDQHHLLPGGLALPFEPGDDDARVEAALADLPALCSLAQAVGQTRFYIWVRPFSASLPWKENFHLHAARLGRAARIMDGYGCRLGLEFIGPRHLRMGLRDGGRYSFIHTMDAMLTLCEASGPNVGLLLDAYHWYTSLGTVDELRALDHRQVVYVHINDAPAGVPVEDQQDLVRCLPGDSGVIDLAGFVDALKAIGYDGPVVPEPFVASLAELPPDQAARVVGEAMRKVMRG